MANYEKPSIEFESLELVESIANRCWAEGTKNGDGSVFYHSNGLSYELMLYKAGNCAGTYVTQIVDGSGLVVGDDNILKAFSSAAENTKTPGFTDDRS